MNRKQKKMLRRIIITAGLLVILQFLPAAGLLRLGLYLIPYGIIGYDVLRKAFRGILRGRVMDENFLMAVASLGAIALAAAEGSGDYPEAGAVMLFYQLGELFQSIAVGKSRRSITALMDLRADFARVERDGQWETVAPDEVPVGTVILVQPGERIPMDGIVTEGCAALDTAALTGESVPRDVAPGDEVFSGCIDLTGVMKLRTTREFGESTAAKILELVEDASSRKSKSEEFISRFARIYTPAVCLSALALGVLPPAVRCLTGLGGNWGIWLYRALTFLVISCPCALVISIPLTFFAGLGGAGRKGVLIKGSNYMETLSGVKTVAMDKTGTLTKGVFEVKALVPAGVTADRLLELGALCECGSNHPVGRSILRAYGKDIRRARVEQGSEIPGEGVIASADGMTVAAGSERLMARLGVTVSPVKEPGTVVYVAADGICAGYILIADELKDTAEEAVLAMRRAGVERLVMLTGDSEEAAGEAARALSLDEFRARLLPGDKVREVERLLKESRGRLAFVGDGINDAPVLARADIGIAMGAMGSDAAIEAADVVLMDDDPRRIADAIRLSRRCLRIVYENIVFALGVKGLCLVLGALGIANMWLAIFADVGVMILAVLNAVRALR